MNNNKYRLPKQRAGFGLLELLIAMALSVLLLAGVVTMFTSSRQSYETNDRLARVQENGRAALDNMIRGIRASGYVGCNKAPADDKRINTLNSASDPDSLISAYGDAKDASGNWVGSSVMGFDYQSTGMWSPALDSVWIPSAADGSDVLLIRQPIAGKSAVPLASDMATSTANLTIAPVTAGTPPFSQYQILILSDCQSRSTFQITAYTPSTGVIQHAKLPSTKDYIGNSTNDLGFAYQIYNKDNGPASLVALQTVVYYVRASTTNPAMTSLWRRVDNNSPEELVEGIDSMQLMFAVDTNNDRVVDVYQDASDVADFNNVVAVSIGVVARSDEPYGAAQAAKTHHVLDENLDKTATFNAPKDSYLRQVFQTTATVRNNAE